MTRRAMPPHLRLVPTKAHSEIKPANYLESAKQLSFPYPETSSVFLVYVDSFSRNDFADILSVYIPRWIFDVRAVPRLDTIAASRLSAFTLFEKNKVSYIDLFGRLGIKSYRSADSNPAFWSRSVVELLKNSESKGPYLFLFDNEKLLRAADKILPNIIKPVIGRSARFEQLKRAPTVHSNFGDE